MNILEKGFLAFCYIIMFGAIAAMTLQMIYGQFLNALILTIPIGLTYLYKKIKKFEKKDTLSVYLSILIITLYIFYLAKIETTMFTHIEGILSMMLLVFGVFIITNLLPGIVFTTLLLGIFYKKRNYVLFSITMFIIFFLLKDYATVIVNTAANLAKFWIGSIPLLHARYLHSDENFKFLAQPK